MVIKSYIVLYGVKTIKNYIKIIDFLIAKSFKIKIKDHNITEHLQSTLKSI